MCFSRDDVFFNDDFCHLFICFCLYFVKIVLANYVHVVFLCWLLVRKLAGNDQVGLITRNHIYRVQFVVKICVGLKKKLTFSLGYISLIQSVIVVKQIHKAVPQICCQKYNKNRPRPLGSSIYISIKSKKHITLLIFYYTPNHWQNILIFAYSSSSIRNPLTAISITYSLLHDTNASLLLKNYEIF